MSRLEDLDSVYFSTRRWANRLTAYLERHSTQNAFLSANSDAVEVIARRRDLGLRMGVNMPAHALLLFLRDQRYKNAYERRPEAGSQGASSDTRRRVDAALFPPPKRPQDHYFGAALLGGTGVRYYGDYCVVLKEQATVIPDNTQVLDRNSYDAVFSPLSNVEEALPTVIQRLRGEWADDLLPIAKLKVLTGLADAPRLATAGTASEALLHDESFVEVHKPGSFGPDDVHEVRESPADAAVEADLAARRARGQILSPEEDIWLTRRLEVDREMAARGLRARIVVTTGRTPR